MKHKNYTHYLCDIMKTLEDFKDEEFKKTYKQNLLNVVKLRWQQYESGESHTYLLTEEDIDKTWKQTSETIISECLNNLCDLGFAKISINDEGKMVYSATEEGLSYLKRADL